MKVTFTIEVDNQEDMARVCYLLQGTAPKPDAASTVVKQPAASPAPAATTAKTAVPKATPAPVAAKTAEQTETVGLDQIRPLAQQAIIKGLGKKLKDVLNEVGAGNVSLIPEDKYQHVFDALTAMING